MCLDSILASITTDRVTAVATVVMAVFTVVLAYVTNRQARLTQESIDLGRQEFIASHRPRLRIQRIYIAPFIQDQPFNGIVDALNIGETDAVISSVGVDVFVRAKYKKDATRFDVSPQPLLNFSPVPSGEQANLSITGSNILTTEILKNIQKGDAELCLLGIITYLDGNKTRRITSFFRVFNPVSQRFVHAQKDDEYSDWEYEA